MYNFFKAFFYYLPLFLMGVTVAGVTDAVLLAFGVHHLVAVVCVALVVALGVILEHWFASSVRYCKASYLKRKLKRCLDKQLACEMKVRTPSAKETKPNVDWFYGSK